MDKIKVTYELATDPDDIEVGIIWLNFSDSKTDEQCYLPNYPKDQLDNFITQVAFAHLRGREVGLEIAVQAIEDKLKETLREIIDETSDACEVCDSFYIEALK